MEDSDSNSKGSSRLSRRGFIGLSAALAAGAAATACSPSGASSESSVAAATSGAAPATGGSSAAPATDISGEISLWAWGAGPEGVAINDQIAYFNTIYPNVKVNWEPLAKNGYEEYPQLLTKIASGNPPDVMRVLNYQPTQLVAEGAALMSLDDLIANDPTIDIGDFLESSLKGCMVDGKTYALPNNAEPYVIYYNVDAFKAAGLPDPQEQFNAGSWDQAAFDTAIDTLRSKAGMRFGIAFESWTYDNECFMGGGTVLSPELSPTINTGASPQMLDYFAKLVADGKAPNPVVGGGAHLEAFKAGQVGMYLMGPWWHGSLEADAKFAFNVTGLPAFNGVTSCKIENNPLAIASGSKNPEAAWAFLKTITDTQGQVIWSAVGTPCRKTALEEAGFLSTPWKKDVVAMLDKGTFTPYTTSGAAVDTAASAALDPLWAGKETAQVATDNAAKAISSALSS